MRNGSGQSSIGPNEIQSNGLTIDREMGQIIVV